MIHLFWNKLFQIQQYNVMLEVKQNKLLYIHLAKRVCSTLNNYFLYISQQL